MIDKLLHDDFICVAPSNDIHQHDYLAPYILESHEKKMILFGTTPGDIGVFFQRYPNTSITYFKAHSKLSKQLLEDSAIQSKKMILCANFNSACIDVHLNPDLYQIFVCHGVPQKLIGTSYYDWFWLFDTSIIFSQKDLQQILKHKKRNIQLPPNQKAFLIDTKGKKHLFIIGGNIRMKTYIANKQSNEKLYARYQAIIPSKKTILYMPTFSSKVFTHGKDLCTLDFFIEELLPKLETTEKYNIIIKAHPNIRKDKFWPTELKKLTKKYPNITVDYTGYYLHFMQLADIMIGDYSSAMYDFLYFEKPILFIDKFNELNGKLPDFEDINHACWLYGAGHIINGNNVNNITKTLQSALENDSFKKSRKRYKDISFDDSLTANDILNLCRQHPKYER